ncbi:MULTISPECIES: hypothetical protein [unclassified Bradyrhizobium]|nr:MULTISPECIES: hypothetical protein [unclassified Bradyrhizobium]
MTPREIMFAVQPAMERENRRRADALAIATLATHDPKQASEEIEALG